MHGALLLNKPAGITANRALQQVRRLYQAQKAGHCGTLDPFATGQLPICFGEATKLSAFLLDADKEYLATAKFGVQTDTGDIDGDVISQSPCEHIDKRELVSALRKFTGPIQQVPPMYSALKQDGKRLYELARKGLEVKRKPRAVTIHALQLVSLTGNEAVLSVRCSKGTYIRTLVQDLGRELGPGAFTKALHRTRVFPFSDQMKSFEDIQSSSQDELDALLIPLEHMLPHVPVFACTAGEREDLRHGRQISVAHPDTDCIQVQYEQELVAIAAVQSGQLRSKRLIVRE